MRNILSVPCGWGRGEPLEISREVARGEKAFVVSQSRGFDASRVIPMDAIAYTWFHTWGELSRFLKWWYDVLGEED